MQPGRALRATCVAVAAALLLGACTPGDADPQADGDGPVRIGVLTSLTGPFTPYGLQAAAGMRLAVDELNSGGGIDGRQVELVVADTANDPTIATTEFERMVEQDGVVAVGGPISSSVGVVLGELAEELRVPTLMVKAGSPAVLTPRSRFTFRTCIPSADMVAGPLVSYAAQEGAERIGLVVADYAYGQAVRAAAEAAFAGTGVALQVEVAPVGETDFTTYLRSLDAFGPDLLAATGHPPGSGAIAVQAADLGIDVPVIGPWAPLATVEAAIGEVADDTYIDFACVDYGSDGYRELARRFAVANEDLPFMEHDAVAGYGIVTMLADAVSVVGTDREAIAEHLHASEFTLAGYSHPVAWTEYGELATSRPTLSVIRRQPPPDGVAPGLDWFPEVVSTSEVLEPTPAG